jgi:predicted ArsR family transcriptional regulator
MIIVVIDGMGSGAYAGGMIRDTRGRIIERLKMQGGQTVEDLAKSLNVTRTAVTSHLAALTAEGLVARQGFRPGRRRPSVLYVLTPAADRLFPKSYDDFAEALLKEIGKGGPARVRGLLRKVADQWIARDLPRVRDLRGRERLERATEILAERGFMPALEPTREGYLLREHNCPAIRLAVAYPEVCDMVHRWLEALFGTALTRTRCLRQGDPFSAYTMQAPPGARGAPVKQASPASHT